MKPGEFVLEFPKYMVVQKNGRDVSYRQQIRIRCRVSDFDKCLNLARVRCPACYIFLYIENTLKYRALSDILKRIYHNRISYTFLATASLESVFSIYVSEPFDAVYLNITDCISHPVIIE